MGRDGGVRAVCPASHPAYPVPQPALCPVCLYVCLAVFMPILHGRILAAFHKTSSALPCGPGHPPSRHMQPCYCCYARPRDRDGDAGRQAGWLAGTFETGMVLADLPWRLGGCQRRKHGLLTMFILPAVGIT